MIKVMIMNSVTVICFTILAIYFKHWWIVLFAYLFFFTKYREVKDDR